MKTYDKQGNRVTNVTFKGYDEKGFSVWKSRYATFKGVHKNDMMLQPVIGVTYCYQQNMIEQA